MNPQKQQNTLQEQPIMQEGLDNSQQEQFDNSQQEQEITLQEQPIIQEQLDNSQQVTCSSHFNN